MCWRTRIESCAEKQVADKPLTVFKVVRKVPDSGLYCSCYFKYVWQIGETRSLEEDLVLQPSFCCHGKIEKGFHSYSPSGELYLEECRYVVEESLPCGCTESSRRRIEVCSSGGNWIRSLDRFASGLEDLRDLTLAKCTIPEGATYYKNENGEVVSDKIIMEEVVPLETYTQDEKIQAEWGLKVVHTDR